MSLRSASRSRRNSARGSAAGFVDGSLQAAHGFDQLGFVEARVAHTNVRTSLAVPTKLSTCLNDHAFLFGEPGQPIAVDVRCEARPECHAAVRHAKLERRSQLLAQQGSAVVAARLIDAARATRVALQLA